MKVYISSHDKNMARLLAETIKTRHGHAIQVVSTWHDDNHKPSDFTDDEKTRRADDNFERIKTCTALFMVGGLPAPGGKFVEAGYALGRGKTVMVIGSVDNMMLHADGVYHCDCPDDALGTFMSMFSGS